MDRLAVTGISPSQSGSVQGNTVHQLPISVIMQPV